MAERRRMSDVKPGIERLLTWVENHPIPSLVGVALLALVAGQLDRIGDDEVRVDITAAESTISTEVTPTTEPDSEIASRSDVPIVPCETLITDDEADSVLFPDAPGTRGMFTFSHGETCKFESTDEGDGFIQIQPGEPADFTPGARLLESGPQPVNGVGDEAVWFAGNGDAAVLAVRQGTDLGTLHFRIALNLPGLDEPGHLERATELALSALPRFPGIEPVPIEPEVIALEEEPVDLPPSSLDEILTDGVESGEWTLGEGLVTILDQMVNGSGDAVDEVPPEASASGIIATADAYLDTGPDDAPEVRALLDRLTFTTAELEQMSSPAEDPSAAGSLLVSAVPIAQEDPPDGCASLDLESPCFEKVPLVDNIDLDPGKYSLYVSLGDHSQWSEQDVEVAKRALVDSAVTYESLGEMPPTVLVLLPDHQQLYAGNQPDVDCRAFAGDFLAGRDPKELEQILAREIAFCLIANDFRPQFYQNPHPVKWLVFGLANYLSGVVYPNNDLEHESLPGELAEVELSTTVPDRTWTNWILFEHLHSFVGPDGVTAMIRGLPEAGDLVGALADVAAMPGRYHDLALGLSDADIKDVGSGLVPYEPQAWELPVSGPTEVPLEVPRFGVRRLHIQVPEGEFACVESSSRGSVRMSWRQGAPGLSGSWSKELPGSLYGETVMTLTTVEDGAEFTLTVTEVGDDPDCSDDEPGDDAEPEECDLAAICDSSGFYFEVIPSN